MSKKLNISIEDVLRIDKYFAQISFIEKYPVSYNDWIVRWWDGEYLIYTIPGCSRYVPRLKKSVRLATHHVLLYFKEFTKENIVKHGIKLIDKENTVYVSVGRYDEKLLLMMMDRHKQHWGQKPQHFRREKKVS